MTTVVETKVYGTRHFESVVGDEVLSKIKSLGWEVLTDSSGDTRLFTWSEVTQLIRTRRKNFRISRRMVGSVESKPGYENGFYELTVIYDKGNVRQPTGARSEAEIIEVCHRCFLELPVSGICGCGF